MDIEITPIRESQYKYLKAEMLNELEAEMASTLSATYKKARLRYVIREVADMNEVLGLPVTDGVEKWLENKE